MNKRESYLALQFRSSRLIVLFPDLLVWSLALHSPELGKKQREVFAVSFGEEVMGFLSVCLSRAGFFVRFTNGESYCAENMSRRKLLEQNEALWKGELAVSGFLERQNGLLELKKRHLWGKKFNTANSAYIWFLTKPHWYHSCSLKPSYAMWSHLSAAFPYF